MSFPRYPDYKASGVEWIGDIPSHWKIGILTRFARMKTGHTPSRQVPDYWKNCSIPWFSLADVWQLRDGKRWYLGETTETISTLGLENSAAELLPAGTVVFSRTASVGFSGIMPQPMATTQDFWNWICGPCLLPEFLLLLFRAMTPEFQRLTMGSTHKTIYQPDAASLRAIAPTLDEQRAIVDFLSHELSAIDELVAKQQRLIELLNEKRQAVISHAVTKGLNPNAPMKPSGIESLGHIPAHWCVEKMKWVARMESGHTPDKKIPKYWENCNIPWVSLNDTGYLKDNDYISNTAYNINELGVANSSARVLPPRAVVFSRDATIGRCAITTRPMAVSQHFIAWICGPSMLPEYLLLRLRSMTQELDRVTTGATLRTIGMPEVRTLVTPVPPVDEQKAIIASIADSSAELDGLSAEAERAIGLLHERRIALISAAVTGKIDVRGRAYARGAAT